MDIQTMIYIPIAMVVLAGFYISYLSQTNCKKSDEETGGYVEDMVAVLTKEDIKKDPICQTESTDDVANIEVKKDRLIIKE